MASLWQYRATNIQSASDRPGLLCEHEGHFHHIRLSESGELAEHHIESERPEGDFKTVLWQPVFELLPKQFDKAGLLEGANQKQAVGESMSLHFAGEYGALHLAGGLISLSKRLDQNRSWSNEMALRQAEGLSFVWVHENTSHVLVYQEGDLLLANSYPVANNAEVLYFALAPFHMEKIHPSKVAIVVWADENRQTILENEGDRMGIRVCSAPQSAVYGPNKSVPFSHFLAPLLELAACELPEGN
ncbi:MAG: DUF3822 family protein [Bacteroidetes bacterium]|nr:DUF3822 family protein [Bacteroidota bacterium]MDA0943662.1 DUF3822 family protein [Bacteroidota bacterium]MDA1111557.1 DUF3822 family protein [Bacteroidota bacterium]